MAVKPILFNTKMVRAILDGRKTVTRRVLKYPFEVHPNGFITKPRKNERLCPYEPPYQSEDILYVRETWHKGLERYIYRADYSDTEKFYRNGKEIEMKWHPSIHMPKEAARIWLKVIDVRVERLQDMTQIDFWDEGINTCEKCATKDLCISLSAARICYLRSDFIKLWNSTIKDHDLHKYGWDANPWVWVIEFERCEKPEGIGQ